MEFGKVGKLAPGRRYCNCKGRSLVHGPFETGAFGICVFGVTRAAISVT